MKIIKSKKEGEKNMGASELDKAIAIASKAHTGQVDKAGQPYILHPLRLMLKFTNEEQRITAVLHDVVEDSDVSLNDLKSEGFSEKVIEAINCLSKKASENYDDFILRISKNDLASAVKIEDIKDNIDITRIDKLSSEDLARVDKYHRALKTLMSSSK